MAIRTDTIVTRYEAVTVSHEQGLDKIRVKQQQLRKELEDWNAAAEAHQKQTKDAWTSVASGITVVSKAVGLAKDGFKSYADNARLSLASSTADVESLSRAAGGLVSRIDLMRFAAQAQHGTFKLTQAQMETTERAVRQYTRAGFDQTEVTKKITDAVVALKDDGLKDLGIRIRATSTDSEKFSAIMGALTDKTAGLDDASSTGAESVQRIGVTFEDSMERVKTSIGKIVVALGPLLDIVGGLAEKAGGLLSTIADGWSEIGGLLSATLGGDDAKKAYAKAHGLDYDSAKGLNAGYATSGDKFENWQAMGRNPLDLLNFNRDIDAQQAAGGPSLGFDAFGAITSKIAQGQYLLSGALDVAGGKLEKWKAQVDAAREAAKAYAIQLAATLEQEATDRRYEGYANRKKAEDSKSSSLDSVIQGYAGHRDDVTENQGLALGVTLDQITDQQTAGARYAKYQNEGFLTKTFGKVGDFDLYSKAFQGLSDAIGGTYEAMVTGAEPAGQAFKKLVGTSVLAVGKQMTVEAVKEEAFALGSLAIGDVPGFVTHQASAAGFEAGSILAGVVASELGAGAGSSKGGGSHGGSAPSGSGAAAPSAPSQNIIVIGDDFADDSPRNRQLRARRLVGLANGGRNSVVTDT